MIWKRYSTDEECPKEAKRCVDSFQRNKSLDGAYVGQIIESKNNEFTVGECVLGNFGTPELKKTCLEKIDLYFDNVGSKHLEAALITRRYSEESCFAV